MAERINILDEIYDYVSRFVVFPDEHSKVAWTLWVAHTHLMDTFYTTPRLHILSAEKQCGKTTLMNITSLLVKNPIALVSPSPASLYTLIEQEHPTLLIDEVDRLFAKKDTSDITMIVNSGFQRGAKVPRVLTEPKRKVEYFDVFGPMMLVGIDKSNMPDTIADRSIPIRLKRRIGSETVEPYRPRTKANDGYTLRNRIAAWAASAADKAKSKDSPRFPAGIEGRNQDKWEALFIVADVTDDTFLTAVTDGLGWGDRARQAALAFLSEEKDNDPPGYGELVLKDLHGIFADRPNELRMKTATLLDKLHDLEESPWSSYEYGKPLSGRGLAKLLKPYSIRPATIRFSIEDEAKGYHRSNFEDAWKRYLSCPEIPKPDVTRVPSVPAVTAPDVFAVKVSSVSGTTGSPSIRW